MSKRRVVAWKYLPMRWPVSVTWLTWLTLRIVDEPAWVPGAAWSFVVGLWVIVAMDFGSRTDHRPGDL